MGGKKFMVGNARRLEGGAEAGGQAQGKGDVSTSSGRLHYFEAGYSVKTASAPQQLQGTRGQRASMHCLTVAQTVRRMPSLRRAAALLQPVTQHVHLSKAQRSWRQSGIVRGGGGFTTEKICER